MRDTTFGSVAIAESLITSPPGSISEPVYRATIEKLLAAMKDETGGDWRPPETAPKDGKFFEVTTAGPSQDFAWWDGEVFRDYFHKQVIPMAWPYVVAWRPVRAPAVVGNTVDESRAANGFPPLPEPSV